MSSECPIPGTHRRLDEAHTFWHACRDEYHHPARFRSNLNAAIQALRNVTFILQKEKSAVAEFDEWYGPWQQRFRDDPVMRWVVKSRNRIVKAGDLETSSELRGWLISTYFAAGEASAANLPKSDAIDLIDSGAADKTFSAPPRYTSEQVIEHFVTNAPRRVVEDSLVALSRRWVDRSLPDYELLDAMGHAFGALRLLVEDLHRHAGIDVDCVGEPPASGCLAILGSPLADGRLACMVSSRLARTATFTVDGEPLGIRSQMWPTKFDSEVAAVAESHYPADNAERLLPDRLDSVIDLVPFYVERAKTILKVDPDHAWMIQFFQGRSSSEPFILSAVDRQGKFELAQDLADTVARNDIDAFIMISESWQSPITSDGEGSYIPPSEHPDRIEVLVVHAEEKSGRAKVVMIPFERRAPGDVTLGEPFDLNPADQNLVIPIRRVWGSPLLKRDAMPPIPDSESDSEPKS